MRKTVFLVIVLLACKTVYAQPFGESLPTYQISELHYENSSGEKGVTYFRYNHLDRLVKAKWTLEDKSRCSTNAYAYDSKGHLVSAYRNFSDSLTSFESFNYDDKGNKVLEFFYRSDGKSGKATYLYNGSRLKTATYNNYKGWLTGILELKYNSNNQKETGTLTNANKVICRISFLYDKAGNLIKEFWDFNGKWNQTFRYRYVRKGQSNHFYSSPYLSAKSDVRISAEDYTYNDEVGGPSHYYYNESGLLAKKVFIRSDSLTTHTFYNYDTKGKLLSSKRVYSDSSTATFTYEYNETDKLIRRNYFKADTLHGFELYIYNDDNELTEAYLKNFDGWLSGIIHFKNDEPGKITTGEFKGEDGFDALISFEYNQNNLVSAITWEFSFGKFQKYTFEYEPVGSNPGL